MPPLVSITMPAWNTAPWIGEAVRSCLAQTYRDWELVVVDDGSTDGTLEAARLAAGGDARVRFVRMEHGGLPAARNAAFEHCRGELIARLDSDDSQDPQRLAQQVAILMARPAVDIVTCGWCLLGPDGPYGPVHPRGMVPDKFMRGQAGCTPNNGTPVARREMYELVRFHSDPDHPSGEDKHWNVEANLLGARWGHSPDPLYYYRRRPGQLTDDARREERRRELRPVDWPAVTLAWDRSPYRTMEFFATSACNLRCPHCSHQAFRTARPDYQARVEDLRDLVDRMVKLEIQVAAFRFTGGEPLLWGGLREGVRVVRASGVADQIEVLTNGMALTEGAMAALPEVDTFEVSLYRGPAGKRREGRVLYQRVRHKRMPQGPHGDKLPAVCNCNRFIAIGRRLYICGNGATLALRAGLALDDPRVSCPMEMDWVRHFRRIDKANLPICAWCLANRRIWKSLPYPEVA